MVYQLLGFKHLKNNSKIQFEIKKIYKPAVTTVFSVLSLVLLQACFPNHSCLPCADKIQEHAGEALRFVGGIGLFFSFTEVSHS